MFHVGFLKKYDDSKDRTMDGFFHYEADTFCSFHFRLSSDGEHEIELGKYFEHIFCSDLNWGKGHMNAFLPKQAGSVQSAACRLTMSKP